MAAKKKTSKKTGKALVIVESPAKARTISKFLGNDYNVQASIGHVRDLPQSASELPAAARGLKYARLGVDIDNDFQPLYVVPAGKKDQIATLKSLLAEAPALWLATDEDREGESISWHLVEVLKPKVPVHRLVFHEITRGAILRALDEPREIDGDMVQAQESRRILDRLFGYEVSPVLWRKIRKGLSAGRVQSVALRLLVEREQERREFVSSVYWDIDAQIGAKEGDFEARLTHVGGDRVAQGRDFDPKTGKLVTDGVRCLDEQSANALRERIVGKDGRVVDVEEKPYQQKPSPPFTTSTLQQEAGRKLRFPAARTMRLAQQLYENGAITYMRTDSTNLSGQAIEAARTLIDEQYGAKYLEPKPRIYKTNVKNAQEAHEAIRPAGSRFRSMDEVRGEFSADAAKLYELIWKRTVASQMRNATGRRMTVRIEVDEARFRAGGKTIDFPGYQRAYVEGSDDPKAELAEQESVLPPLEKGQTVAVRRLEAKGHETQPPARFTEASLVKELDRRGIGRPSTWASIIKVLLDRMYAFKKGSALVPSFTAFAVIRMLRQAFGDVMDYDFTARMEDDLDRISNGELDRVQYLQRFWSGNGHAGLEDLIEKGLGEVDSRTVCSFPIGEHDGREIEVRVGKYGLFVSDGETSASIPEDVIPDEFSVASAAEILAAKARGPVPLGDDPESGEPVYVKSGRFGPYIQLGEMVDGGDKPKMVSLLQGMEPESVDLAMALRLLSLPRDLGAHPEQDDGEHVFAKVGRYGPYIQCGKESRSVPPEVVGILDIDLAKAVELLKQPRRRGGGTPKPPLKELGDHPDSGAKLVIKAGRYGPYVTDGSINASLPRDIEPEDLTLDEAVVLLQKRADRIAAGGGKKKKKKKRKAAKKKAKKKATKKKAAGVKKKAKKAAAKSPASKTPPPEADSGA